MRTWKKIRCLRPSAASFGSSPLVWRSVWTSPWPCGFVSRVKGSFGSWAKWPSLLQMAGTLACDTKCTCSHARGIDST